ncbi:ABC transporter permease [Vibrio vulnificus]|nr:ABC transporter permease [Vibrio vulnificus]EHH2451744.1 ABC transporter permease [Vibrio vulnificus]EIZ4668613.1 ABC transporter permease [Vibrio vulnificus]
MSMTELIKEAYIDPIRSVMVVDDEYPTLAKLINGEDISKAQDRERLLEVINMCKDTSNNWMLDVHDGQFNGRGDVGNLHHSDLLILDYHLEGNGDDGRGDRALSVLSSLAQKDHFNLVIVHTKGYASGGVDEGYRAVFKDIVFHLQKPRLFPDMPENLIETKKIEDAIDAWDVECAGINDALINVVTDMDYLALHSHGVHPSTLNSGLKEIQELKNLFDSRPRGEEDSLDNLEFKFLLWYVLYKKGKKLESHFGPEAFDDLRWSDNDGYMWVKAGNLFVSVVGKNTPTPELPTKLLDSLVHWNPHPHRLLLAKLRHKLDEHGFTFANNILSKQFTQAGWLRDLLSSEQSNLEQQAWYTARSHLEEMSWLYKEDLSRYLVQIVQNLMAGDEKVADIESRYSTQETLSNSYEIFKFSNAFHNSLPVEGTHLTTGHVLKNTATGSYFLVVTPACDLVPGRNERQTSVEAVIQHLYPIANALRQDTDEGVISDETLFERCKEFVNSKKLIFMLVGGSVKVFSAVSQLYKNASPNLMSMAFENEGQWNKNYELKSYNLNLSLTPPQIRTCDFQVIGQLRYEYALHHSKTSGEHVSRIGLDYKR